MHFLMSDGTSMSGLSRARSPKPRQPARTPPRNAQPGSLLELILASGGGGHCRPVSQTRRGPDFGPQPGVEFWPQNVPQRRVYLEKLTKTQPRVPQAGPRTGVGNRPLDYASLRPTLVVRRGPVSVHPTRLLPKGGDLVEASNGNTPKTPPHQCRQRSAHFAFTFSVW